MTTPKEDHAKRKRTAVEHMEKGAVHRLVTQFWQLIAEKQPIIAIRLLDSWLDTSFSNYHAGTFKLAITIQGMSTGSVAEGTVRIYVIAETSFGIDAVDSITHQLYDYLECNGARGSTGLIVQSCRVLHRILR
jgi:hypothetical protein